MIQRIQSVYLLVVTILIIICLCSPAVSYTHLHTGPHGRSQYTFVKIYLVAIYNIFGNTGEDTLSLHDALPILEYYEGFLMAVDSLKEKGVSIDLYSYDTHNNTSSIKNILDRSELKLSLIHILQTQVTFMKLLLSLANVPTRLVLR